METSPDTEAGGAPRVAVVIPCFDDGATVADAVASAAEQEPCEVVVVDDGSKDAETLRVLEELEQKGTRLVRQANAGPAAARMAGVAATSARYVYPLDADDLLAPGALTALADALDSDDGAAAAWGDEETFGSVEVVARQGKNLDPWLVTYVNEVPISSLMRRTALEESGGWAVRSGYEDWDLWMALAERGYRGIHVPRVVSRYRMHAPRRWAENKARHAEIYAELRARHAPLFGARAANWRRSRAPLHARLLLPAIARLPVGAYERHRLMQFALHPLRLVRVRLGRR